MVLRALLLQLQSLDGEPITLPKGHHAHAFFLRFIEVVDPELSRSLHDEQRRKPYTIARADPSAMRSIVQTASLRYSPSDTWLRLTILDDTLFERFVERVTTLASAENNSRPLRLGQSHIAVTGLLDGFHRSSIVGQTCFEELLANAEYDSDVSLQFATPTAFSLGSVQGGGRRIGVLPDASLVFHSLLRKWNEFAPADLQLDPVWRQVIDEECVVASHDVRTDVFAFPRYTQVGFIGWCRYRVMDGDLELRQLVNALADFAAFAGVGSKTTMGMGQTWRSFPTETHWQPRCPTVRPGKSAAMPTNARERASGRRG